jgi:hypothetical protein
MPHGGYALTLRSGPRVKRAHFADLGAALARLEDWVDEQAGSADRGTIDLRVRRFEPIQQVAARGELAGPRRLRGGIDVRGDGSSEAYIGRWRRRLVEPRSGESAVAALRRALADHSVSSSP